MKLSTLLMMWLATAVQAQNPKNPTLLGQPLQKVTQILGMVDSTDEAMGLFGAKSMFKFGSSFDWEAYKTAVGFKLKPSDKPDEACYYVIFEQRDGSALKSAEIDGLLYLCANAARWGAGKSENTSESKPDTSFLYQETDKDGLVIGRTLLAVLRKSHRQLVVYSPEWMPDLSKDFHPGAAEDPLHAPPGNELDAIFAKAAGRAESPAEHSKSARLPDAPLKPLELFSLPKEFRTRHISSDKSIIPKAAGRAKDSDLDGLTDAEEAAIGTDPQNPDTDGDALRDGWEVHPVNGIDLRAKGASPLHRDIFVEMDYMMRTTATNGLGPNSAVIATITEVFANAPVENPDKVAGINIHLEMGNELPFDADLNPYLREVQALKAVHFDRNKAPFYHYMIWANGYSEGSSSGVSLGIPHSDFIVTLGHWNNQTGGTDTQKVGTFVHELGHNLGLTHGGTGHDNHKPNHISVMNYAFQTSGILKNGRRVYDYQPFALPSLDEDALNEQNGLGKADALNGIHTKFRAVEKPAHGSIDWDLNSQIDSSVRVDLNSDGFISVLSATPNQWKALIYDGGSIGKDGTIEGALKEAANKAAPLPFEELTEEMDKAHRH